jgi:hypothetical protein
MRAHQEAPRGAASKVCWVVLAVAGLGAAPPDTWAVVRATLPPVSAAPDDPAPVPTAVPEPKLAPAPAIPTVMPAKPVVPPVPGAHDPTSPTPPPTAEAVPAPLAEAVPLVAGPVPRVYVINGVDPFGWAGLRSMADRLRASGYPDTRFGGWYQSWRFEREIRQSGGQEPVVIIGYSFGVYRARAMANRLTRDGIPVAMVGYVGGDYLRNTPSSMPGVGRVVNVRGDGFLLTGRNLFFNGTDLSGAENMRLSGVRHFELPKRQETFDALVAGINSSTVVGVPTGIAGVPSGVPVTVASSPLVTTGTPSPAQAAVMSMDPSPQRPQPSRPIFRLTGRDR